MGEIILVTGGARSGKSAFAESLLDTNAKVSYIAANGKAQDQETKSRVQLHQARRSQKWTTTEAFLGVADLFEGDSFDGYLLDCATMLTTNYFFHLMKEHDGEKDDVIDEKLTQLSETEKRSIEAKILNEWQTIITAAKRSSSQLVIVTNEVGLGIVPENAFSRWFRDLLGYVNQFLGKEADAAFLVIAGISMKLK